MLNEFCFEEYNPEEPTALKNVWAVIVPDEGYGEIYFFERKDGTFWTIIERDDIYCTTFDEVLGFLAARFGAVTNSTDQAKISWISDFIERWEVFEAMDNTPDARALERALCKEIEVFSERHNLRHRSADEMRMELMAKVQS